MGAIKDFGMQMLQGVAGAGMGMVLGKINDKRQIEQQRKLQDMQMQGNKEMLDYGKMKDYEMWMKTGYPAQLEQMKKAGLSPGLMYGTSGGGGTTVGGSGMGISGGNAPSGGGEMTGMASQAMQLGLLRAQKENIEADTANKKAETPNKGLTGENIVASTKNLGANTENTIAKTALTRIESDIADMQKEIKGRTLEDVINIVDIEEQQARTELDRLSRKNILEKATYDTAYKQIKANLAATVLENEIRRKQPDVMDEQMRTMRAQVTGILNKIQQEYLDLEYSGTQKLSDQRIKWSEELRKETGLPEDIIEKVLQAIILRNVLKPGSPAKPIWQKGSER